MRRRRLLAAMLPSCAFVARADEDKPLHLLVGYPPGGGTDSLARILAEGLREELRRPIVVENRPGAGGRIAAEQLKHAPADGSVLMVAPNGLSTVQAIVYRNELRYDPARDHAPVAKLVTSALGIAVRRELASKDAVQLVAWIKSHPDEATFSSPAAGGLPHFVGMQLARATGSSIVHVPFNGGAPAALAVARGEVAIGVSTIEDFVELERAGRLKIVAVAGPRRWPQLPGVPTLLEQGIGVRADAWVALWAPGGMPAKLVDLLSEAARRALARPGVRAKLSLLAMEPDHAGPVELGAQQRAEWDQWTPVIQAAGFGPPR